MICSTASFADYRQAVEIMKACETIAQSLEDVSTNNIYNLNTG